MSELREIINEAVQKTVVSVLLEMNLTPEIITLSQIRKVYGRELASRARKSRKIEWFPLSVKGNGIAVYCRRKNFQDFLFDKDYVLFNNQ